MLFLGMFCDVADISALIVKGFVVVVCWVESKSFFFLPSENNLFFNEVIEPGLTMLNLDCFGLLWCMIV